MLKNKRYFIVLQPTKSCQISFNELLAYSLIVYRSGRGKGTTQRKIMQEFGLAKGGCRHGKQRGIAKLITRLQACELVPIQAKAKAFVIDFWLFFKSTPSAVGAHGTGRQLRIVWCFISGLLAPRVRLGVAVDRSIRTPASMERA